MNIDYCLYEIKSLSGYGDRQGALLRVHFEEDRIGYAVATHGPNLAIALWMNN